MVILSPGEVLYVPRHWWHFVECLEPCISVNTWVEMVRAFKKSVLENTVKREIFASSNFRGISRSVSIREN